MVVDAHVHVAADDRERYPTRPTGVGSEWWTVGGVGVDALLAAMDAAAVERAVVVQAVGVYGHDCRYAADAAATAPTRLALVASVDLDDPDFLGAARTLAEAGAVGLRLFGVGGTEPHWLHDGRAEQMWRLAADTGLTLVPTLFDRHLAALRPLLDAHPGVPTALDHAGFPDLTGGAPFRAAGPLLELADLPALHLKVSTHLLHEAEAVGDPADLVDALAGAFGPARLCWGSDHPQTQHLDYPGMVALGRHAARHLHQDDRRQFLHDTAASLWFGGR